VWRATITGPERIAADTWRDGRRAWIWLRAGRPDGIYWATVSLVCEGTRGQRSNVVRSGNTRMGENPYGVHNSGGDSDVLGGDNGGGSGGYWPNPKPIAPSCPTWAFASNPNYGGYRLSNGDTLFIHTCAACAWRCRGTPGCDTWVYGEDPAFPQSYRKCWLKAAFNEKLPTVIASSGVQQGLSGYGFWDVVGYGYALILRI